MGEEAGGKYWSNLVDFDIGESEVLQFPMSDFLLELWYNWAYGKARKKTEDSTWDSNMKPLLYIVLVRVNAVRHPEGSNSSKEKHFIGTSLQFTG